MSSVGYLCSITAQDAANSSGMNYWFAYIQEICAQLGAAASPVNATSLKKELPDLRVLMVGDSRSGEIGELSEPIARWVEQGGTLIGFATEGLDALFGNKVNSVTPEPDSPYHPTALLRFLPHALTTGVVTPRFEESVVPVFGPVRKASPQESTSLASLLTIRQAESPFPAITCREVGEGRACYFAFDLAQTMWLLHKGRPIESDNDLDGYMRLSDGVVVGNLPPDVPYADLLLFFLQSLLHQARIPMIHQIPPRSGKVADFLAFFGGDDEGSSDGVQVEASEFMKARGLPYHINIMPKPDGTFGLTEAEFSQIVANGHEPSLHYNFIDGFSHPTGFTREDVLQQHEWYISAFGREPVATVNHWCRWCGWSEPAKWMLEAGGRADNSRIGATSPPLNPVNRVGFAFGTAYPNYFYDDWSGENRRIDFLSEPIAAYEVGYLGDATDFDTLHRAVDLAADYHYTMNFFYHPIYIARYPACGKAIDELMRYAEERSLLPVYCGPDALWEWWDARSKSSVEVRGMTPVDVNLVARCAYPGGMVVKVPIASSQVAVEIGGQPTPVIVQEHFGLAYSMIVCPVGESVVSVRVAS